MLTFVSVQGQCVVAPDSSCQEPEEAYSGLSLPLGGEGYLVHTHKVAGQIHVEKYW